MSGKKKFPWVNVVSAEDEGVEEFRVRGKIRKKGMVSDCGNDEREIGEYRNMRGRFDGKRVMYIEDDDEEEEEEYRCVKGRRMSAPLILCFTNAARKSIDGKVVNAADQSGNTGTNTL
ncbi:hypothetical protein BGX38DRAFT_1263853 [Terfezia claveryi]|nr:hypothetical protein BGX38DRAFT_1263853 [Terfezia claveryi]